MPVDIAAVRAWFDELQRVYAANRDRLTELDAAIGDADHGSNMDRGFTAVKAELEKTNPPSIAAVFKTAASTLIKTVGGASGPLYGTFFLRAGAACPDRAELEASDVASMFSGGIEGIVQRGKAVLEDKTMVDALLPAKEAMQRAAAAGESIASMMENAAVAAQRGVQATVEIQARKGRASYLGARSIGHEDPGATSAYLLLRAAADVWRSA